jgi:hypothetical protein
MLMLLVFSYSLNLNLKKVCRIHIFKNQTLAYMLPLVDMLLSDIKREIEIENKLLPSSVSSLRSSVKRSTKKRSSPASKKGKMDEDDDDAARAQDDGSHAVGRASHAAQHNTRNGRIRAIILCPTSELAVQIGNEARKFSPKPIRVMVATGGETRPLKTQKDMLEEGVDLLVATVGRAASLVSTGYLTLAYTTMVNRSRSIYVYIYICYVWPTFIVDYI